MYKRQGIIVLIVPAATMTALLEEMIAEVIATIITIMKTVHVGVLLATTAIRAMTTEAIIRANVPTAPTIAQNALAAARIAE